MTVLLATFTMLFAHFGLFSQTQISVITGVHSANTKTSTIPSDLINLEPISQFHVGALVDQSLDDILTLRTGLIYQKKGFKVNESTGVNVLGMALPVGIKLTNEIGYLEVPLMLKYKFNTNSLVRPYVSVGPSFGYALSGQLRTKATAIFDFNIATIDLDLISDNFNRFDVSANALAGVEVPYRSGNVFAEVGYGHALNNFVSDDFIIDAEGKHAGWTFSLGYGIRF